MKSGISMNSICFFFWSHINSHWVYLLLNKDLSVVRLNFIWHLTKITISQWKTESSSQTETWLWRRQWRFKLDLGPLAQSNMVKLGIKPTERFSCRSQRRGLTPLHWWFNIVASSTAWPSRSLPQPTTAQPPQTWTCWDDTNDNETHQK